MKDLIPITVWLAGRSYRLRVSPDEEAAVRKSVKIAEDKIIELRSHYAGKDDQDFLAMCLLTYAADGATDALSNPLLQKEFLEMSLKIDKALEKSA